MLDALDMHAHDHPPFALPRHALRAGAHVAHREHVDVLVGALVLERRAAVHRQPAMRVGGIDRHHRDARIGQQMAFLGAAARRVEEHVTAVAVDPDDCRVRRAVGAQRRHDGEVGVPQELLLDCTQIGNATPSLDASADRTVTMCESWRPGANGPT